MLVMKLTPIKIAGKKYQVQSKDGDLKRKFQIHQTGEVDSAKESRLRKYRTKKSIKKIASLESDRIISKLENLPTELIVRIFLDCLNLEFPRSSPILTACLSSKSVYTQTITAIFGPTWQRWIENDNLLLAAATNHEDHVENVQLQVGKTVFVNFDDNIYLTQVDSLLYYGAVGRHCLQYSSLKKSGLRNFRLREWQNVISNFNPDIKNRLKDTDTLLLTPQEHLDYDYNGFIEITILRDKIPDKSELWWETNHDVAIGVEIPSRLLCGPWKEEDIKLLFWAIKSGAELNWLNSTAGETALCGLKLAISIGDIRVIYLLLWKGLRESGVECMFHHTIDGRKLLMWALWNAGGDPLVVMAHLFTLARDIISSEDKENIHAEISFLKFKAIETSDGEKLRYASLLQPLARKLLISLN